MAILTFLVRKLSLGKKKKQQKNKNQNTLLLTKCMICQLPALMAMCLDDILSARQGDSPAEAQVPRRMRWDCPRAEAQLFLQSSLPLLSSVLAEPTGLARQQVPRALHLGKRLRRNGVGAGSCSACVVTWTPSSVVTNSARLTYYPQKRSTEQREANDLRTSHVNPFSLDFKEIQKINAGLPGELYDIHHTELHRLRTKWLTERNNDAKQLQSQEAEQGLWMRREPRLYPSWVIPGSEEMLPFLSLPCGKISLAE